MEETRFGLLLMNLIAAYFLIMVIAMIIGFLANLFLSFMIAEDAFYRGSDRPVAWGVFSFFLPWLAIFIYYLTRHRRFLIGHSSADPLFSPMPTREDMKTKKIKPKIVLWILGIFAGSGILAFAAFLCLVIFLTTPMK